MFHWMSINESKQLLLMKWCMFIRKRFQNKLAIKDKNQPLCLFIVQFTLDFFCWRKYWQCIRASFWFWIFSWSHPAKNRRSDEYLIDAGRPWKENNLQWKVFQLWSVRKIDPKWIKKFKNRVARINTNDEKSFSLQLNSTSAKDSLEINSLRKGMFSFKPSFLFESQFHSSTATKIPVLFNVLNSLRTRRIFKKCCRRPLTICVQQLSFLHLNTSDDISLSGDRILFWFFVARFVPWLRSSNRTYARYEHIKKTFTRNPCSVKQTVRISFWSRLVLRLIIFSLCLTRNNLDYYVIKVCFSSMFKLKTPD